MCRNRGDEMDTIERALTMAALPILAAPVYTDRAQATAMLAQSPRWLSLTLCAMTVITTASVASLPFLFAYVAVYG